MAEDKEKFNTATFSQKITAFAKRNINTLIIVLISVAYIFYGMITIEESGQTVAEIVGGSVLSTIVGFAIKQFRMRTGTNDGLSAPIFVAKTNAYGKKKEEIAPFIDELGNFCAFKNRKRLRQKQEEYLINYSMSYDKFIKGEYNNSTDPLVQKVLKKVRSMKVFAYTPLLLTNAYGNSNFEEETLNVSIAKYERTKALTRLIITVLCGVLFGYFVPRQDFSVSSLIWSALQVALYLVLGQIEYNNAYYFVTQTLRGKIERVICILDEFTVLRSEHEGIFKVEVDEK